MGNLIAISRIPFAARVPQPGAEDEYWRVRNTFFRPEEFPAVFYNAIRERRHWRVAHLIERHFSQHLVGTELVERGMEAAARSDNAEAARLLLRHAERGQPVFVTFPLPNRDLRDMEVRHLAFKALTAGALHESDGVFSLALETLGGLTPDEEQRRGHAFLFMYETEAAIAAAGNRGRADYLDLILENGAWPDRFRHVYALSLEPVPGNDANRCRIVPAARDAFRGWMIEKGIADEEFLADPHHKWSQSPPEYLLYLHHDEAKLYKAKPDAGRFHALNRALGENGLLTAPFREKTMTDVFNLNSADGRERSPREMEPVLRRLREIGSVVRYAEWRPAPRTGQVRQVSAGGREPG